MSSGFSMRWSYCSRSMSNLTISLDLSSWVRPASRSMCLQMATISSLGMSEWKRPVWFRNGVRLWQKVRASVCISSPKRMSGKKRCRLLRAICKFLAGSVLDPMQRRQECVSIGSNLCANMHVLWRNTKSLLYICASLTGIQWNLQELRLIVLGNRRLRL